jgi:hypothetical protein
MNLHWVDKTRPGAGEPPHYVADVVDDFPIHVYRYPPAGKAWFLSCRAVGIERLNLDHENLGLAKSAAATIVRGELKKFAEAYHVLSAQ